MSDEAIQELVEAAEDALVVIEHINERMEIDDPGISQALRAAIAEVSRLGMDEPDVCPLCDESASKCSKDESDVNPWRNTDPCPACGKIWDPHVNDWVEPKEARDASN